MILLNSNKIKYIYNLIINTPHYGWVLLLQITSGFFTVAGIPMLIPILNHIKEPEFEEKINVQIEYIDKIFLFFRVDPSFYAILFIATSLIILGQALTLSSTILVSIIQYDLSSEYRKRTFNRYSNVDWLWLITDKTGWMNHAILKEADAASVAHLNSQRIVIHFIQVAFLLLISMKLSFTATFLAIVLFAVLSYVNSWNSKHVHDLAYSFNQMFKKVALSTSDILNNKKFIKASFLYDPLLRRVFNYIDETVKSRKLTVWREQLQTFWVTLSSVIFIIFLILFRNLLGLDFSELLVTLLVFQKIGPQFSSFSSAYLTLNAQIPIHRSLEQRLEELSNNKEKIGEKKFNYKDAISFDNVSFKYPEGETVINVINIKIEPLQTLAIVGSSGVGKSTILDLILGLLKPTSGVIHYGSIPDTKLDQISFRRNVAYVSQETTLLDGTILDNLSIGDPDVTDDIIKETCRLAYIDNLIDNLPEGINTEIGENGIKLSGGQKQRIALGRAILKNPNILILDEATSELDTESEMFIQKALNNLRRKMTIIIVAHRLSTVRMADIIYVIENGSVYESGTYEELINNKGRFHYLHNLQNTSFDNVKA